MRLKLDPQPKRNRVGYTDSPDPGTRKQNKRAQRRAEKDRMKAKAKRVFPDLPEELVIKWADHLKVCSCEMCRNPRRSGWRKGKGRTRREAGG